MAEQAVADDVVCRLAACQGRGRSGDRGRTCSPRPRLGLRGPGRRAPGRESTRGVSCSCVAPLTLMPVEPASFAWSDVSGRLGLCQCRGPDPRVSRDRCGRLRTTLRSWRGDSGEPGPRRAPRRRRVRCSPRRRSVRPGEGDLEKALGTRVWSRSRTRVDPRRLARWRDPGRRSRPPVRASSLRQKRSNMNGRSSASRWAG